MCLNQSSSMAENSESILYCVNKFSQPIGFIETGQAPPVLYTCLLSTSWSTPTSEDETRSDGLATVHAILRGVAYIKVLGGF